MLLFFSHPPSHLSANSVGSYFKMYSEFDLFLLPPLSPPWSQPHHLLPGNHLLTVSLFPPLDSMSCFHGDHSSSKQMVEEGDGVSEWHPPTKPGLASSHQRPCGERLGQWSGKEVLMDQGVLMPTPAFEEHLVTVAYVAWTPTVSLLEGSSEALN